MFSITVAKASAKLGVSPTRVRQLIRSGVLAAEQVAGIWLIDEKSVEARREHNPGRGRPSAPEPAERLPLPAHEPRP